MRLYGKYDYVQYSSNSTCMHVLMMWVNIINPGTLILFPVIHVYVNLKELNLKTPGALFIYKVLFQNVW